MIFPLIGYEENFSKLSRHTNKLSSEIEVYLGVLIQAESYFVCIRQDFKSPEKLRENREFFHL